ncbi:MAG: Uncharacterised protein [Owenweeksia sp. TMED14]|nr:MAG: Uncharacterised protein [Owenweeksia sp. TMED14]
MILKIKRYRHYGCTSFRYAEDSDIVTQKFYWSFFELNNDKTITLLLCDNWNNKGNYVGPSEIEYRYTSCYEFTDNFEKWFDKNIAIIEEEWSLGAPSKEEEKHLRDFFNVNIESKKGIATDTIFLGEIF